MNKQVLRNASLYIIGLFVLLPTLLLTIIFAPMGAVSALGMFMEHNFTSAAMLLTVVTCGTIGVRSMCILFFHFKKDTGKPVSAARHCIALLCGSAVSIVFVISFGGTLMFRIFFFGWPLLGALYFLGRLFYYYKSPSK